METNAQPPRIQVALATGKLVLPEQGCLGQGGCEAKPDYDKVWKRAVMSLVAGLSPIIKVWKPNAQLNIDENPCRDWRGFFLILGDAPRSHSNLRIKSQFLLICP